MLSKILTVVGLFSLGVSAAPKVGRVKLGKDPKALEVSRVALGGLHFSSVPTPAAMLDVLHTALDVGITTLDLADIYGYNKSAELVGQAFALEAGLREKFEIVYKTGIVFPEQPQSVDSSPEYIERAVKIALTQLNTDYIDVLMPHVPDLLLDAPALAKAFKALADEKKVKYFGVSDYSNSKVSLVKSAMKEEGLDLQIHELELSALTPTPFMDGRVDYLYENKIVCFAWGPLGGDPMGGANRLFNFNGDRQVRIRAALQKVGQKYGVSEDVIGIAWILRHPSQIVPILGTTNLTRIQQQASAVDINLTRQEWTAILGASASDNYQRWEQQHSGQWHDVVNDVNNIYGSPLGVDVPVGFCDFDSCKMPGAARTLRN